MKLNTRSHSLVLIGLGLLAWSSSLFAQTFSQWQSTGTNWSTGANWSSGNGSAYGQLEWKGAGNATSNNDFSNLSQWRLYFQNGTAYTLGGNAVNLFDFSNAHSWVLSDATANQTINLTVNFAATVGDTFGQVSTRNTGNLTMANIGITGSQVAQVRFAGESSGSITVGGVISGSGKQVVIGLNQAATDIGNTVVNFNGANTYTGDTFIVAGKLSVGSSGSIASGSTLQLGQISGTAAATLDYSAASGGQTIANNLTVRSGSAGTKTLSIGNTSGTQTFTGAVTLNDNLTVTAGAGSQSFNTSSFNVTSKTLTVNTSGTTTISNALTSSLGAGGSLVKQGTGTLVLSSTSNSYTGTSSGTLNANGTQIAGGTLAIAGDTSLGVAPAGAYNNIQFTASGTLRSSASISLNANRNISIASGATAHFDSNGNTFTINGIVNGTGGLVNINGTGGTVVFAGNNTYTGATSVSQGTLQLNHASALGTTAAGTSVNNGATLKLGTGVNIGAEALSINGSGVGGAGALQGSGFTNSYAGQITAATNATISANGGTLTLTGGLVKNGTTLTLYGGPSGGTFDINTTGISGSSANSDLVVDNASVNLNTTSSYNGPTYIRNAGTLNANVAGALPTSPRSALILDDTGSGSSTLGVNASNAAASLTGASTSSVGLTGSSVLTVGTSSGSTTFAGSILGLGSIVKDGASTQILSGTNSYDTTTISGGTLQVGDGGSSGTLGTGNVTNNAALVFNRSGNITLSNIISGSGTLTQNGSNIITINVANSYTGATTINTGTLRVTANDALGTSAGGTTVNSGGSLRLSGVNYTTAEALSINGTGSGNSGALNNGTGSGSSTYAGQVTVASNATIKVTGGGQSITLTGGIVKNGTTLTVSGTGSVIVNTTGISGAAANSDLVVDGGTLVVNVASTYNGPTTVQNGGTLIANNASGSATGTGNVTVDSTSTLSGTGKVDAGTNVVIINGALVVGDSSQGSPTASMLQVGTSGAGSTTIGAAAKLYVDLFGGAGLGNNTADPSKADILRLFGTVNFTAGAEFHVDNPNGMTAWAANDSWKVIDPASASISGSAPTFFLPSLPSGLDWDTSGLANTGFLSIVAVPEPSRALLLMLGLMSLGFCRRRA